MIIQAFIDGVEIGVRMFGIVCGIILPLMAFTPIAYIIKKIRGSDE